jgi:hypothetical protein
MSPHRWCSTLPIIKEAAAAAKQEPGDAVAIVSYDEKPGI